MANKNQHLTVLREHDKIVKTRYVLSLINFIAILLGTLVTLFFVQRRGIYEPIRYHVYALIGINALQILLCFIQFLMRVAIGKNSRILTGSVYAVGAVWVITVFSEMVVATVEIGALRIDLLVIALIQLVIAAAAYFVWPMMDRSAIDALTGPRIRENEHKRELKAGGFVLGYIIICVMVVVVQAGVLFVYKMPPNFYDLFAESRAIQYSYDRALDGYIVQSVYRGTSTTVNIPAVYNDKPVIGIAPGALTDENVLDKYKLTEITIGTERVDSEGNVYVDSNLGYISENAIQNDRIVTLNLPGSVHTIAVNAVRSQSLRILNYSAKAPFLYGSYNCPALETIMISGSEVGTIDDLEGMPSTVSIKVDRKIYDSYRKANIKQAANFSPILEENEFCVDFFTGVDSYYLNSIILKVGAENNKLNFREVLVNSNNPGTSPAVDTEAYIANEKRELNTDGAKPDSAFRGWYRDAQFTNEFEFNDDGTSDPVNGNLRLYARWIPEYTGQLDWGTYTPEEEEMGNGASVENELHWTDEDLITFPVVSNRAGYTEGVTWKLDGEAVQTSEGISENVTLKAEWHLDAPTLTIQQDVQGAKPQTQSPTFVQFVFDENNTLTLTPTPAHGIPELDASNYTYMWEKVENPDKDQEKLQENEKYLDRQTIQNVASGGKYTVTVTLHAPCGETATATAAVEIDVLKKPLEFIDVNLHGETVVYDGAVHELLHEGEVKTPSVTTLYQYFDAEGNLVDEGTAGNTNIRNAGNYRVKVSFYKTDAMMAKNYETRELTANLTIQPKKISVTEWTDAKGLVYSGEEYTCLPSGVDGLVSGDTVDSVKFICEAGKETNAGSYVSRITDWENKNYQVDLNDSRCSHEWVIAPKVLTVQKWQPSSDSAVWNDEFATMYDGQIHGIMAIPDGVVPGDEVAFEYNSDASATNAGTYNASISKTTNTNYTFDKTAANIEQQWAITSRPLTVSFDKADFVYSGDAQVMNAHITGFVSADYDILKTLENAGDMFLLEADPNLSVGKLKHQNESGSVRVSVPFGATNAGKYKARLTGIYFGEIGRNYTLTAAEQEITVEQKELAIRVDPEKGTRTYNGKLQSLCLWVDGVCEADLGSFDLGHFTSDRPIQSLTREQGRVRLCYEYKNAGEYTVTISEFKGNKNYKLSTEVSNTLTIDPQTLKISQWTILDKSNAIGVPMDMGETAQYPYNKLGYEIGYVLSGVVENENITLTLIGATGYEVKTDSYKTTARLDGNVAENKNYTFNEVTCVWSIIPRELEVTWSYTNGLTTNPSSYDGREWSAEGKVTPIDGDTVNLIYDDSTRKGTNAGAYRTVITGVDNANYKIKDKHETFEWTIGKRPLTLSWSTVGSDSTLCFLGQYNGQYQGPSFTVGNLIGEDTIDLSFRTGNGTDLIVFSAVKNDGSYAFTAEKGFAVNAGEYSLTSVAVPTDSNYSITLTQSRKFRIDPKPITLSGVWSIQNSQGEVVNDPVYNTEYFKCVTTLNTSELCEHLGVPADVKPAYSASSNRNASTYTTGVTGLEGTHAGNYTLRGEGKEYTWTIARKPLDLQWNITSFPYNPLGNSCLASFGREATTDDDGQAYLRDVVELTYQGNEGMNAGDYIATASLKVTSGASANYMIRNNAITNWHITPMTVQNLTWSEFSFTYNGEVQRPTAHYKDPANGATIEVSAYEYDPESGKNTVNASTYSIKATKLSNSNYTLEGCANRETTYEIKPLPVKLAWYVVYSNDPNTEVSFPVSTTKSLVYNGMDGLAVAKVTNLCGADNLTLIYSGNNFRNVKAYTATVSELGGTAKDNYTLVEATSRQLNFSITKKPVKVSWLYDGKVTVQTPVYDGNPHTLVAIITDVCEGEALLPVYDNPDLANGLVTDAATHQNRVIGLSGEQSGNYALPSNDNSIAAAMTIRAQKVTIEWKNDQMVTEVTYNGGPQSLEAPIVKGSTDGKAVSFETLATYTDASSSQYPVTIKLETTNYVISDDDPNKTRYLKINQQLVTLTWDGEESVTYDGAPHGFTVSATGLFGVDNSLIKPITDTYTDAQSTPYTFTAKLTDEQNYAFAPGTTTSKKLTIHKKLVTLHWDDERVFSYDGKTHSINVSATTLVAGESVNADHLILKPADQHVDQGTYPIRVTLVDSTNYAFDSTAPSTVDLKINPAKVTIEWFDSASDMTYNGKEFGLKVTVVAEGGIGTLVEDVDYTLEGYETAVNAGSYKVSVVMTNSNYITDDAVGASHTYTIKKRPVTYECVEWVNLPGENTIYNGKNNSIYINIYGVDQETPLIAEKEVYTWKDAKSYNLNVTETVKSLLGDNYTLVGDITKIFTILPKPLTPVWEKLDTNGVYHPNVEHGYNLKLDGICTGDESLVSAKLSGELRNASVANYTVTITGLDGSAKANYTLTSTAVLSHSYRVEKQPVRIEWESTTVKTYNGQTQTLVAKLYGSLDNRFLQSIAISGEAVGEYALEQNLSDDDLSVDQRLCYKVIDGNGARNNLLQITPATAKVIWYVDGFRLSTNLATIVEDGASHTLSYQIVDAKNPSVVLYNEPAASRIESEVGEYTLKLDRCPVDNYVFGDLSGFLSATMKITKNESATPATPPVLWEENKDVVTHLSFDELRINDTSDGIFPVGESANWNGIASVEENVTSLEYYGWVGVKGEIGTFGYRIDRNEAIYDPAFTQEADESVTDVAQNTGADTASRMLVHIDVSTIEGDHEIQILYMNAEGVEILLGTFTLSRTLTVAA